VDIDDSIQGHLESPLWRVVPFVHVTFSTKCNNYFI